MLSNRNSNIFMSEKVDSCFVLIAIEYLHCGQSITAYSVRLMFATVRLFTKSHCHPLSHKNVNFFVIFKPFLSSVSSMDM